MVVRLVLLACGLRSVAGLLRDDEAGEHEVLLEIPGEPVRPAPPLGTPQRELLPLSPEERLKRVQPVAWVHIPKCGSSFGNALIDLPGMCDGIPHHVTVNKQEYGETELGNFDNRWDVLGEGCGLEKFAKWGNHQGMGGELDHAVSPRDFMLRPQLKGWTKDVYEKRYLRHAMGFFRRPRQRMISGYHHGYHSFHPKDGRNNITMLEYRERIEGCMVKMLTRQQWGNACGSKTPTQRELERAIVRIREAFVFVGITEKWQASICTFHAMFGGQCRASDFGNVRLGTNRRGKHTKPKDYDEEKEGLGGWHDRFDEKLYEEALAIHQEQRRLYNVTVKSCGACLKEAQQQPRPWEW